MIGSRNVKRALGLTVVTALALAACGDDSDDSSSASDDTTDEEVEYTGAITDATEPGDPVEGGSITVGLEAETNSWLPGEGSFSNAGVTVAYSFYDPLMKINQDGETQPYLAESLESNDDLTEWTLTLREGIEFHDGTPLNAEALKDNFDNHLNVDGSNTNMEPIEEMTIEDDLTVIYHASEPFSALPDMLTLAPGWPFSPTAVEENGEDAGANPVGTGPFVFESWERDNRLVVSANEDYWQDGQPHLDQIVFQPIPDEDTRTSALQSGDIDVLQALRQSTIVDLRDQSDLDNYEHLGNNSGGVTFNNASPPFDDLRVRRAAILSADQETLIDVLGGAGVTPPANQLFSVDDPYWTQEAADAYPSYDAEAAMEELQSYIDDPDRSDGEAPGTPVSFRFDCPPDPSLNELSQMYESLWTSIGFDVELRQVEQATHIDEAISGDYQAKCFRFGEQMDPALVMRNLLEDDSPQNYANYDNEEVRDLLAELRATENLEERQDLVRDISVLVNEEAPLLFTANTLTAIVVQDHVRNVDGWAFPDGEVGGTVPQSTVMWNTVWTVE